MKSTTSKCRYCGAAVVETYGGVWVAEHSSRQDYQAEHGFGPGFCPVEERRGLGHDGSVEVVRITVPPRFYFDHVARDLPGGVVISEGKAGVTVDLTIDELKELRSDASYYADSGDPVLVQDHFGLVSSARATVRRIDKHGALKQLATS